MEAGREIEEEAGGRGEEKIYVAVSRSVKDNKSTLLWALHHSAGKKIGVLHVHQPAQMIPFLGGKFPANKLKEKEVRAYRDGERLKMNKMLNEYLFRCAQVGVRAEKLCIENESIEKGIVEIVTRRGIKGLIMGAPSGLNTRTNQLKSKKANFVCQQAPVSCRIWFISKGCLIQTRESCVEGTEFRPSKPPIVVSLTETFQARNLRSRSATEGPAGVANSPVHRFIRRVTSHGRRVATVSLLDETGGTLTTLTPQREVSAEVGVSEQEGVSRTSSQGSGTSTGSSTEEVVSSLESISLAGDEGSENGSALSAIQESDEDIRRSSVVNDHDEGGNDREVLGKLRQAMAEAVNAKREASEELYKRRKAEKDALEAIRRVNLSENLYTTEVRLRKEMELQLARDMLELNKLTTQRDESMEELRKALDQKAALETQLADSTRALQELEEKIVNAVELLVTFRQERDRLQVERDSAVKEAEQLRERRDEGATSSQQFFSEFAFSEIDKATNGFDPSLVIGEGGYGSVYRGFLRNTDVAIKLLNSSSSQGRSEFQREVDVLSRMRHPNIVTLIGTCPEAWSLVYEYLPNGNLEDRLACKENTQPLSWQTRIRIAVEICSALIFLHHNKPHGIIHGDLKPANILLDANFSSKLGDFGICCLLSGDENSSCTSTPCCTTENLKGTLVYMDPECLSTGELTLKSDVYSFGLILLQLLTGRPALGIAKEVQCALDEGILSAMLDSSAGVWPFVQAKQLTHLALRCCEMNRKNRPDLISDVWRVLEPMKAACGISSSFTPGSEERCQIPSYFLCPIFQETMSDPRVAADGYTYEAEAIKGWLESGHDTSPMTNLKLAHTELIPNHSLRSAIEEWKQQH